MQFGGTPHAPLHSRRRNQIVNRYESLHLSLSLMSITFAHVHVVDNYWIEFDDSTIGIIAAMGV
jgi:hypothetical protein